MKLSPYSFGCGQAGSRTGIIFNSGLDDFSHPTGKNNYFGLPPSSANYWAPNKQAVSSMAPIILTDHRGQVKIVIGASGGTKIITATALVINKNKLFILTRPKQNTLSIHRL